jgi:NAD(P)-dependent dehydrogenase (short-subunit alcohol dehydrogenase family)
MAQLIGKLAVVTGASAGIGKEIAWGLYKLGANVVIPVRNVPKGNSVREEFSTCDRLNGIAFVFHSIRGFISHYHILHIHYMGAWFSSVVFAMVTN